MAPSTQIGFVCSILYIMDVSMAEWLAWMADNCGRIGAIGSSISNGLNPNK